MVKWNKYFKVYKILHLVKCYYWPLVMMPENKIVLKEKYLTMWDSATSILQMKTYLANEAMILVTVQLLSCVWLCNSMTAAQQVSLSSTIPRACLNSCPSSQGCHPTISSSVAPFSSCSQSFPASGSFQWVNSSYQVDKIMELQRQCLQWIFRTEFL